MYNLYEKIKNGEDVRQSLSIMRGLLRDKKEGPAAGLWLDEKFEEEPEFWLSLLKSEDPKIRKNAALCWALHWVSSPRGSLTVWQTSPRKNKSYNVKHPPLEQNGSNGRCFYLLCRPHFTVPAHHSTPL